MAIDPAAAALLRLRKAADEVWSVAEELKALGYHANARCVKDLCSELHAIAQRLQSSDVTGH